MDDILRIGMVQSVDKEKRTVRVFFSDVNMMSGELKVLKSPPFIGIKDPPLDVDKTKEKLSHYHELEIFPWLPKVGDTVLCIYNPGFNEDGFVLGAI